MSAKKNNKKELSDLQSTKSQKLPKKQSSTSSILPNAPTSSVEQSDVPAIKKRTRRAPKAVSIPQEQEPLSSFLPAVIPEDRPAISVADILKTIEISDKKIQTPASNSKTKNMARFELSVRPSNKAQSHKIAPVSTPAAPHVETVSLGWRSQLIARAKDFHSNFSKLEHMQIIPAQALKSEQSLQECLLLIHSEVSDFHGLMESVFVGNELSLEQKAMLREAMVKLFSINFGSDAHLDHFTKRPHHHGKYLDNQYIVDVFALPMFGSVASAKKLLANQKQMTNLCALSTQSGILSAESDNIAILSAPLDWRALSSPSVLNALCSMWGELVANSSKIDEKTSKEIRRSVYEILSPYALADDMNCGFVLPGVRVWRGSYVSYQKNNELFNRWTQLDQVEKISSHAWWNAVAGHITMNANVDQGSLMIRPPVRPLVAQAQALSWHLTQQVYERLGTLPFAELNFVTVSENKLALRAYDHRKKILASSDVVNVFDVITSADDFSELMQNECSDRGPRSLLRELSRATSLKTLT